MLSDTQVARLLDIGMAGCHKGHVLDARIIFENILVLKPQFIPARIGMAFSHIVLDEFKEAEEILSGILEQVPEDIDARALLGFSQMISGKQETAVTTLLPVKYVNGPQGMLATSLLELAGA